MKKHIILSVLFLLLLCSGCQLKNRQPSSDFVPSTHATREAPEETETQPSDATAEPAAKVLTQHSIRMIASEEDSYVDIYGNTWKYTFRIPFVDYPTREVSDCNNEIDKHFRQIMDAQKKLVTSGQPLKTSRIDYECYYTGNLITLNIHTENTDNTLERTVYCFRSDGTMAVGSEILKAVWMDEEDFLAKLRELLEARYIKENAADIEVVTYDTNLQKTLDQVTTADEITLYADAEDKIFVLIPLYDARGGSSQIELEVKP